jgi:NAD-dependent DNA ligase
MADKIYILDKDDGRDDDGQPRNYAFNAKRVADRSIDELLGICKGMIVDGLLTQGETDCLVQWVQHHCSLIHTWPVNVLAARIERMLTDKVIDEEERQELFALLSQLVGGQGLEDLGGIPATRLPLSDPPPTIEFSGRTFCFTGKFHFGTRSACAQAVIAKGGFVHDRIAGHISFLVLGILGSRDWIHSSYGRKIEEAVKLRDEGSRIAIVAEEHWVSHL